MSDGSLSSSLAEADAALAEGDARTAFTAMRGVLDYPAPALDDAAAVGRAYAMFSRIAAAIAGPQLGEIMDRVAASPNDIDALYDAGFALYEQRLFAMAATLLERADRLAPGRPKIVAELSSALEGAMFYGAAALTVDRSGLADQDPMLAYLSGFNWLMVGSVERAANRVEQLPATEDPTLAHVFDALGGMVRRAQALAAAGIDVGEHALTAWHAILNGTLLTHESPFGHDEPMRGRYAMVADSPGLMREGIDRLARIVAATALRPQQVVAAPDRSSQLLAMAVARVLELPLVHWRDGEPTGIVVAWNLDTVGDDAFLAAHQAHRPGTLLFAHASDWVEPFPYAPDVTTFLGQTIMHPYSGGALRVDPVTGQVGPAEPDQRDDAALVEEIVAAGINSPSETPVDDVLAIDRALAGLPEVDRLGVRCTRGRRPRQRTGSPVQSNRFV